MKTRVLLVEDEPFIRDLLAEVFLEADFDVVEAGNGHEAMARLRDHKRFDLLLTDVHMPDGTSGIEVARHARALQPDLLVVFATGRPDSVAAFGRLGPREARLDKPFTPSEALRLVERLIGQHGQRQAPC